MKQSLLARVGRCSSTCLWRRCTPALASARPFLQACKVKEDTRLWKAIKRQHLPRRGRFPQTLRSNRIFWVFPKTQLLPRPLALTHPSLCPPRPPPRSSLGPSSAVSGNEMIAGGESSGKSPGQGASNTKEAVMESGRGAKTPPSVGGAPRRTAGTLTAADCCHDNCLLLLEEHVSKALKTRLLSNF